MPLPSISDAMNVRSLDDLKALFGLIPFMIGEVVVDVINSLEANYEFEITNKPIEEGFISDARIAQPVSLTINGIFVNSLESMTASGAIKSLIAGNFSLASWKQKRDALLELKDKNMVIDVVTPDKLYPSMMIQSLSVNRSNSFDACFFSIQLVEVRIRSTELTDVTNGGHIPSPPWS
jgi:hypothetical protein